jgi:hypothetical protein
MRAMMVYFATVRRTAPVGRGGELVRLDWDTRRVVAAAPLLPVNPTVDHDPNPRGGTRGGRGVLVNGDKVFAATYHSLHVFTRDLKPLGQISHPLFSNLHELAWDGDSIWVTSTGVDAAIRIDQSGRVLESWWPREDPETVSRFGLLPLEIDKAEDNRLKFMGRDGSESSPSHVHLNAAAMNGGHPLMLLNRFGSLVQLNPTRVMLENRAIKGCHNVIVTRCGHVLINDSHHMAVCVFDASGAPVRRIDLSQFAFVQRLLWRNSLTRAKNWLRSRGRPQRFFRRLFASPVTVKPIYVRGLCETPRGTILVGISPAALLEVDWRTGRFLGSFTYSTDLKVCVHGLACAP